MILTSRYVTSETYIPEENMLREVTTLKGECESSRIKMFFVIWKKNNQVTFFHVYQHVSTAGITFIGAKWRSDVPHFAQYTLVHVLMYTYYLLALQGPEMHKKLTKFKKYLTTIQLKSPETLLTVRINELCSPLRRRSEVMKTCLSVADATSVAVDSAGTPSTGAATFCSDTVSSPSVSALAFSSATSTKASLSSPFSLLTRWVEMSYMKISLEVAFAPDFGLKREKKTKMVTYYFSSYNLVVIL
ncbi:unnamed protein product, partial [Timema podura]|nr:unnamed protein product [Timema podura]